MSRFAVVSASAAFGLLVSVTVSGAQGINLPQPFPQEQGCIQVKANITSGQKFPNRTGVTCKWKYGCSCVAYKCQTKPIYRSVNCTDIPG